jgi:hypothetical protein
MQLRALFISIFIVAFGLLLLGIAGCGSPDGPNTSIANTFADATIGTLDALSEREGQARKARQPGNPEVRVWANMRTGLYHCPGDALWGKADGKYMTQSDARLDAFRPAHHACQ